MVVPVLVAVVAHSTSTGSSIISLLVAVLVTVVATCTFSRSYEVKLIRKI